MPSLRALSHAACAAAMLAWVPPASAQDFPNRPIRVVVAFPAGGPTDFVGRLIAARMTGLLGQRVFIDNRPGANGTVGGGNVAQSDPDGYSLFLTTAGAVAVSPHMTKTPYAPLRDFAPVAEVTTNSQVLVVSPKLGITTAKQLVALAKKKPGGVTFASTGIGSPPHLTQVLLADSAGVKFLHVPYRGAAPALTDLLGGQVQVFAADVPAVIAQIRAGTVVPIGVAADRRDGALPEVPTLAEQGYANTEASNWYALLAPAHTPPATIATLNRAVNGALDDPKVRAKLVSSGANPVGGTAQQLAAFLKAEYERWGRVVAAHHITQQ